MFIATTTSQVGSPTDLRPDLRFLRKRAASNRKFSSLEMDVIPLVDQEGDRA